MCWGRTQYNYAPGYAPGTSMYQVQVHTKYILNTYWYEQSTYSVHTQYRGLPAAFPDCNVALTSQSCDSVFFGVHTLCILGVAQCCNGTYSGIIRNRLVLLCRGTYLLVMLFTIQEKSTFWFGTQYIWICTALLATRYQELTRLLLNSSKKPASA